MPSVLSLFAAGKSTGLVIESGEGATNAVPIFEGFAMMNAAKRMDLAGRHLTEYLNGLLFDQGQQI